MRLSFKFSGTSRAVSRILLAAAILAGLILGWSYLRGRLGKQQIAVGLAASPKTLHPLLVKDKLIKQYVVDRIYRSLVTFNSDFTPAGDLLESWTVSQDGVEYRLKLKKNQFWQDKTPITAEDAAFTIGLIKREDYQGPFQHWFDQTDVEVINNREIVLRLNRPDFKLLSHLKLPILPKKIWESGAGPDADIKGYLKIGSAGYRVDSIVLGEGGSLVSVGLESDENRLLYFFYPNEEELVRAYKLGEVEMILTPRLASYQALQDWPNLKVREMVRWQNLTALSFNLAYKSGPKRKQRGALSLALAREHFLGEPSWSFLPPQHWAYSSEADLKELERDESPAASELLVCYLDSSDFDFTAQILAQELQGAGWKVELKPLTKDEWKDEMAKRACPAWLLELSFSPNFDFYPFFHSSQSKAPGLNLSDINDRRLDQALVNLRRGFEHEEQVGYFREIQAELSRELPVIPLSYGRLFAVYQEKVDKALVESVLGS